MVPNDVAEELVKFGDGVLEECIFLVANVISVASHATLLHY